MPQSFKVITFPDDEGVNYDVVPGHWIFNSSTLESKASRFPDGPFTTATFEHLSKLIENSGNPDSSWPIHRVRVCGSGRTYEEASKAAERLQFQAHAFSTDGESSVEQRMNKENDMSGSKNERKSLKDAKTGINEKGNGSNEQCTGRSESKTKLTRKVSSPSAGSNSAREPSSSSSSDSSPNTSPLSKKKKKKIRASKSKSPKPLVLSSSFDDSDAESSTQMKKAEHEESSGKADEFAAKKRPRESLISESSSESTDEDSKKRRSRSKEKQSKKKHCPSSPASASFSANQPSLSSNNKNVPNRSRSESPSREKMKSGKIRSNSCDTHQVQSNGASSSPNNGLPPVPEDEEPVTLAAMMMFLKKMHNSYARRSDLVYGATVESHGKLDTLTAMMQNRPVAEIFDIEEPDELPLPITTMEDFDTFDAKLKNDRQYRKKILNRIKNSIPTGNVKYKTHHLSTILRKFLTKDLVRTSFTAIKPTEIKSSLKQTTLYQCLLAVHLKVMTAVEFDGFLKSSFNSAADWDGGRMLRQDRA